MRFLPVQVARQFAKEDGSGRDVKGSIFKLIDLEATLIINPDDCQKRQVRFILIIFSMLFPTLLQLY